MIISTLLIVDENRSTLKALKQIMLAESEKVFTLTYPNRINEILSKELFGSGGIK